MSLGSRIATLGRARVKTSPSSTPREPFLFLYPPGIRKSPAPGRKKLDRLQKRLRLPAQNEKRVPSARGRIHSRRADTAIITRINVLRRVYTTKSPRSTLLPYARQARPISKIRSSYKRPLALELHSRKARPISTTRRSYKHPSTVKLKPVYQDHSARGLVLKVRRVVSGYLRDQVSKEEERTARQVYQQTRIEEGKAWAADWRAILTALIRETPEGGEWLENQVKVVVPEGVVTQLLGGLDDHIWDIATRYDCTINLNSPGDSADGYRTFLVSGPKNWVAKTVAAIVEIAPQVNVENSPTKALPFGIRTRSYPAGWDGGRDGSVRYVNAVLDQPRIMTQAADKLPKPSVWTIDSFNEYVQVLTTSRVPNHLHGHLYRNGKDHITTVLEVLRQLFADRNCRNYISRAAFHKATAFAINSNRTEDARILFVRGEMAGLKMNNETFNIMLRGAAKAEDLNSFHFILRLMLQKGHLPNSATWMAFMMASPKFKVKLHLVVAMKEKGFLYNIAVRRAICQEFVKLEIDESIELHRDQSVFLKHMDAQYGNFWLTISSANHILRELAGRGLISSCLDFFSFMDERSVSPDVISFTTVLSYCRRSKNLEGAIEFLSSLNHTARIHFHPNEDIYSILFHTAWNARCYNVARLVWRYACLTASTTYSMRKCVLDSLQAGLFPTSIKSSRARWLRQAGLIVTSTKTTHINNSPIAKTLLSVAPADPLTESSDRFAFTSPNSISQRKRRKLVQKLLYRVCNVFRDREPTKDFIEMLVEAYELDRMWKGIEWTGEKLEDEKGMVKWMLDHAIAVPNKPRGLSSSAWRRNNKWRNPK
ncbi:hypothetical protein B7494_g184 [Chlorociboria aeruginascens]|nr:hypothetical protein B7494_g184 [Chlorociboria aeruginascens]